MIGHIADLLCVLLDAQRLWIIGNLRQLSLGLFKVRMVLYVRLDLGVFRNALQLRRVRDCCRLGLGDVPKSGNSNIVLLFSPFCFASFIWVTMSIDYNLRFAVWELVESFVSLHIENHAAFGALEACLVP